jgi:uncharacterized cupredoxin-like copper-binding protein
MSVPRSGRARFGAAAVLAAVTVTGVACGAHGHPGSSEAGAAPVPRPQTYGHGALTSQATRTVEVRMLDSLRFEPDRITVQRGEIVTFRLVNAGHLAHEFTIGGPAAQELHDAQMAEMDMSGEGQGMAMPGSGGGMDMKMSHDPAHAKYLKALAKRIAMLDRQAAATDSVHVLPGETKELTWAFSGPELPTFACHVAGHWKAGMTGTVASP